MQGTATGHSFDTSIVETALNQFGSMLRGIANQYHFPYEELRQEIAVLMLEQLDKLPHNQMQLKCYLRTCAKRISFNHCSHVQTMSLDEPLYEEDDTPLAETLAAPPDLVGNQDTTEQDQKIAALYAALRRLPLDEQRYVREVFGLNAYQPIIYDYKTREKDRTRVVIGHALYRHLRHDTQLASEVLP